MRLGADDGEELAGDDGEGSGRDQAGVLGSAGGGGGGGGGMFGSLQWTQDDLLNSLGAYSSKGRLPYPRSAYPKERLVSGTAEAEGDSNGRLDSQSGGEQLLVREPKEHHLVLGLKPMRDKYLITALGRMSAPIAQMFPELEGYTGE